MLTEKAQKITLNLYNEAIMKMTASQWIGLIRILFGLICAANTILQANSYYLAHFQETFHADWVPGQPDWLVVYGHMMADIVQHAGNGKVAMATVVLNGILAISLITGIWLRYLAWIGVLFNLWLWSTVGGMGGPYIQGATDPGTAIIYALTFMFVIITHAWERISLYNGKCYHYISPTALAAGRILFGCIWLFDAFWKWQPYFLTHALTYLQQSQQGQPVWIIEYIGLVITIIQFIGPVVFGVIAALSETLIALSLITGLFLRWMLLFGVVYSAVLWTTAEGFGGPYGIGFTGNKGDVLGTINIYIIIFLFLIAAYHDRYKEPYISYLPQK